MTFRPMSVWLNWLRMYLCGGSKDGSTRSFTVLFVVGRHRMDAS
jgi:hypothetical protein